MEYPLLLFSYFCSSIGLFLTLKEGVPSGKLDGLHLEEVENLGRYVLLIHNETEGVLIKPFVGHDEVTVVTA